MKMLFPFAGKHRFSIALFLLSMLVTVAGCSDDAPPTLSVKSINTTKAKPYSPAEGYVPAFFLDRKSFLAVDDSITKYKDKLVLQVLAGEKPNSFSFTVFTIADEDKTQEDVTKAGNKERFLHPVPFANALQIAAKPVKIINQRTREDDYQKLLKEVKRYNFVNYIIFMPEVDGDHVRFKISGVEKLPVDLMATGFATSSYYSRSF